MDLVAETRDKQLVAIQVKFRRDPSDPVIASEVQNLVLTISNKSAELCWKLFRSIFVAIIAVAAALSGAVFFGNATAGIKATYYACANADDGALRRVSAEESCLEGEERLVWSDGQPEPTPAHPSKVCAFEASGTWQEGNQKGSCNLFAILELECEPGWLGATVFETDYVLTVDPFPNLIRVGEKDEGKGEIG